MKRLVIIMATVFVVYEVFKFIAQTPVLLIFLSPLILYMLSLANFVIKSELKSMKKETIHDNKVKAKDELAQKRKDKKEKIEHYNTTIKPMYEEGRNLFNSLMKGKKMKKKQLEYFLELINSHLGQHVKFYHNYKFETATKEVYVKMKNYNLNEYDWEELINFLKEVEKQCG